MADFSPGTYARPLRFCCLAVLLSLALLTGWLQVRPGKALLQQSLREQSRLVYVPACRGALLDRDGVALSYTVPGYSIVIRPELIRDPRDTRTRTLEKLSAAIASLGLALGKDFYDFRPGREEILRHLREAPAMPMTLWEDVDADVVARWAALRDDFPATELLLSWRRQYAFPALAPHLRGRVRREAPRPDRDLDMRRFWNANSRVLRGISGMELALENELAGHGGTELLQTDVLSYRSKVLKAEPPDNGDDIRLSIWLPAQLLAQTLYDGSGYRGAVVAIDMASGEVLVMHSSPGEPLDGIASGSPGGGDALVNRALAGYYPPGSVIKPLLALYALEHGIAGDSYAVECPGFFQLGQRTRIGCSHIHGNIAMRDSLAHSCNTYYCSLVQQFSDEQLDDFARLFGFGRKTGGVLSGQENPGVAFTPSWVREHRQGLRSWRRGDAANAAIGQGGWAVTPMQMAMAMNFALTGRLLEPLYLRDAEVVVREERHWSDTSRQVIAEGMRGCVEYGTGAALRVPGMAILAKTGTAEVGRNRRPHAWVVAASPAQSPRHLVVVVVENGGSGGRVAGPVAAAILQKLALMGK